MPAVLIAVPLLLFGAASAAVLRSNRASAAAAIGTQLLAALLVLPSVARLLAGAPPLETTWPWPQPIGAIAFRVDALSAFFLSWSLPMTLAGTVYALGYLKPQLSRSRRSGPHYALLNLVSLSFLLIYATESALLFLLGWEIAAVAAWLLVIWNSENQKIRFAGFNYLVSTHVGLFVLGAAFMLLHSHTGSFDLRDFGGYLARPSEGRAVVFLLLVSAFALKSAFFPFHTWLPRAHSAAPAHISALMSGVIHKAGLFALLRFTLLMGQPEEWMGWSLMALGAASAVFGALASTTQRDLKRLLGYSSTENVGIAALGFGMGYLGWTWNAPALAAAGIAGGAFHLLNHALFKCLLFYAAGAVYRAMHSVDIERLGGLARGMPRTTLLFLVGALAIAALPPLNGFMSEALLYSGLLAQAAAPAHGGVAFIAAAALLAFVGAVSAFAMVRAFGVAFLGSARDAPAARAAEPPASMLAPMLLHAAGALLLGVWPELGLGLVRGAVAIFPFGEALEPALLPLAPLTLGSRLLALALGASGVLAWLRGRSARRTETWGCGYGAPNPRMQYTGSSFSWQLGQLFAAALPVLERQNLPTQLLPDTPGHLSTHHPDPVERRVFEVLGQGEQFVSLLARRIPLEPRFAFAAGLVALFALAAWALGVGS